MLIYSTLVDKQQILDLDLNMMDSIREHTDLAPSVATQLSVIAWNRYEFAIAQEHGVNSQEHVGACRNRGKLKSRFDFDYDGIIVSLYDE